MIEPRFRIGQSVYLKDDVDYYIALHNKKYDMYGNPRPRSLTVVGIVIDICIGGTQVHYKFIQLTALVSEVAIVDSIPEMENLK